MTTVLIVDDEWMVRATLRTIMESADDMTVVGEAGDGGEALQAARTLRPDVVLMDIRMPQVDGLTATERITALKHSPKVVVLTTFDLDEYVRRALYNGAVGFLLKDATAEHMVTAVRSAAAGDAMLSPQVTRRLLAEFAGHDRRARQRTATLRIDPLTGKEREVLAALGEGLANAEIASRLCMSEATAKTHVSRILNKLHVANRVQAALLAQQAGLLDDA